MLHIKKKKKKDLLKIHIHFRNPCDFTRKLSDTNAPQPPHILGSSLNKRSPAKAAAILAHLLENHFWENKDPLH